MKEIFSATQNAKKPWDWKTMQLPMKKLVPHQNGTPSTLPSRPGYTSQEVLA